MEFGRLVRAHDSAALEPWMAQADGSVLAEFRDFAAVRLAVEFAWRNAQTEG